MTTPTTVSVRLQLRADTAANWTSANPTLLANELGRETDTGKIKIGDGSTAWSSLAYQAWATLPIAVASGGTGQTSYTNGQLLIGNTTGNTLTKATLTAGSGIAITNGTGSITVAASGISDAQIAADAEIAVSKLADGAARQLLQTDAAGTGVEWASNIDIPGTLDVTSAATFDSTIGASAGTASLPSIAFTGDLNTGIYSPGADQVAISTNGTGRLFVDASGRVLTGTSTARSNFFNGSVSAIQQVEGANATDQRMVAHIYGSAAGDSAAYIFAKHRSTSIGGNTIVNNNDTLGLITFQGSDGSEFVPAAYIYAEVDGTPGANDMPGRIVLSTTADGASSPTERLRITSAGLVGVGTSSPSYALDIRGSGVTAAQVLSSGSDAALFLKNTTASTGREYYFSSQNNGKLGLVDATAGAARVTLDESGRLGVGTTGPAQLLHINSTGTSAILRVSSGSAGVNTSTSSIQLSSSFSGSGVEGTAQINANAPAGGQSELAFLTSASGNTPTERLRIDSSGRVGIGTSSPSAPLTFAGSTGRKIGFYQGTEGYSIGVESSEFRFVTDAAGIFTFRNGGTYSSSTEYMRLDASGRLGIGTTSPGVPLEVNGTIYSKISTSGDAALAAFNSIASVFLLQQSDKAHIYTGAAQPIVFSNNNTERARIDSSGRLLVGTSSTSANSTLVLQGASSGANAVIRPCRSDSSPGANDQIGAIVFGDSSQRDLAYFFCLRDGGTWTAGSSQPTRLTFSTTKDGQASPTEALRISSTQVTQVQTGGSNDNSLVFQVNSPSNTEPVRMYVSAGGGANANLATVRIQNNSSTGRSLNASGTINASGADYAEYMLKSDNFTIAKGDICGVSNDGLLTNIYLDAVSYLVKSTNPSYVGGDGIWGGTEKLGERPLDDEEAAVEWDSNFEKERAKVDRIAFAGQVPVNVTGATPGQYIVPVEAADGGIEGIAKNEADLTLAEYMRAVGKVIAIEDDGRARIIVKVA